jgi:tetratricopeptide (TPR) repeat protein
MAVIDLATLIEMLRFLSKPLRLPDDKAAVRVAIDDVAAGFPDFEVKFGLVSWVNNIGRSRVLQAFVSGERSPLASKLVEDFVEGAGFFVGSDEQSYIVAAEVLQRFWDRLLFRLAEKRSGYPIARLAAEVAGVKQLVDARLPDFQLPLAGDYVEESPTPQSKVHHHRVSLARDLLREGHANSARTRLLEIRAELGRMPSSAELRFRIAINLGVSALELGDLTEAEGEFSMALREVPENPKALANLSLLSLLKGDSATAVTQAERAHALDSTDAGATAALIQALARAGEFRRLDELIEADEKISTNPRVTSALGQAAFERGDYENAAAFLEKAIGADGTDGPSHLWLGTVLWRRDQIKILADPPLPTRVDPDDRALLERAESLLTRAAEIFQAYDNPERRCAALANRAAVRSFLGRPADALADCNQSLALGPPRDETLANRGRLLLALDRPSEAIDAFNSIVDTKERAATAPLLASAYLRSRLPSKAAAVLEPIRHAEGTPDHDIMVAEQLILAYVAMDEPFRAESVLAELQAAMPSHPGVASIVAQRRMAEGKAEEAISVLQETASKTTGRRADWIRLQLATLYQGTGRNEEAAALYDQLVDDATPDTEIKCRYVVSLYNAGRYRDALERAQRYRGDGPAIPVISEIESLVLERSGDLRGARQILEQLSEETAVTPGHLVRLSMYNLRLGDNEGATKAVRRIRFEAIENDPDSLLQTAGVYDALKLPGALRLLYQARRIAPGRADTHLGFVGAFLQTPADDPSLGSPEVVSVDTAVSLRRYGEEKTYLIVEDATGRQENELSRHEDLAQRLLGKRAGEKVLLAEDTAEASECEIVRVENKYVAAAKDTLDNFNTRFPSNTELQRVTVPAGDISKILAAVDSRHAALTASLEEYRRSVLPLELLALRTGLTRCRTWAMLVADPEQILRVSTGSAEGVARDVVALKSVKRLALDLSALLTIRFLELEKAVLARFELTTDQILADSLINAINLEQISAGPHMVIGKEGDQYVRTDVPAEAGERAVAFFAAALTFVRENTTVVKVPSLLEGRSPRRELVAKAIGTSGLSAVLLAHEQSIPLFADDLGLGLIGRAEFGVPFVSIQSVLLALRESGSLTVDEYHQAVGKLVAAGYQHIAVQAETILVSLRQGHMEITPQVVSLCGVLEGPETTLESAVTVAAHILKGAALETLADQQRDLILDLVLRSLVTGRLAELAIPKLVGALRLQFALLPAHLPRLLAGIRLWTKQHRIG